MKIVSITPIEHSYERYDLEIEDNHNFIVCGIVVHNSNICAVYSNGNFHIKSRKLWKREYPERKHLDIKYFMDKGKTTEEALQLVEIINAKPLKQSHFWKGLRINEPLQKMLRDNEGLFVFGELFGNTNRIKYGIPEVNRIAIFDSWQNGNFLDSDKTLALARKYNVEHVPVIYEDFDFDLETVVALAEGNTLINNAKPNTIREGIVVRPHTEIYDHKIGRVVLKCPSAAFQTI